MALLNVLRLPFTIQDLPERSAVDAELQPYFSSALRADDPQFWRKLR